MLGVADVPGILLTAVGAFVGTNIDDFVVLLLIALSAPPEGARVWRVAGGQYLGFAVLVALSLAGGAALRAVPVQWVGLLGLIPVALGIGGLLRARRPEPAAGETPRPDSTLGVAALTIANGGDNVSVYVVLFRHLDLAGTALTLGVRGAARHLVRGGAHPRPLRAAGARVRPGRPVGEPVPVHRHRPRRPGEQRRPGPPDLTPPRRATAGHREHPQLPPPPAAPRCPAPVAYRWFFTFLGTPERHKFRGISRKNGERKPESWVTGPARFGRGPGRWAPVALCVMSHNGAVGRCHMNLMSNNSSHRALQ
jgi:cadmium resistance transporter